MTTGPGQGPYTLGTKQTLVEGRREGRKEGREGGGKKERRVNRASNALPATPTSPAHPPSSFVFTCTTSEQLTLILHTSSREGLAPMMRGLSSLAKGLSPAHGWPPDNSRNEHLLRCRWPQLLWGTLPQPIRAIPEGDGGSSRPCSREQWPRIVVGFFSI